MTLYRVDLVQTVVEETTVYIEANNEEDAADKAMAKSLSEDEVGWEFCDTKNDPEVISVTPVERPDLAEKWARAKDDILDTLRP